MAKSVLKLGRGLTLPIEAVTETIGIVGQRGGGKTHTAGVCVEQILKAGQQTVIIDPADAGANAAGNPPPPSREEVVAIFRKPLRTGARKMLDLGSEVNSPTIAGCHPTAVPSPRT